MNRRTILKYSVSWLSLVSAKSWAQYQKVPVLSTTKEEVSSVLVSADESKLVVMTPQFHYIFGVFSPLVDALKGTFHPFVQAAFSSFRVDTNGHTRGTVSLWLSNAPDEAVNAAIQAGFLKTPDGAAFTTTVFGDRYRAGNVQPTKQYKLNKTYEIEVVSEGYEYRTTPIASVAGEFALGGLILLSLPAALMHNQ